MRRRLSLILFASFSTIMLFAIARTASNIEPNKPDESSIAQVGVEGESEIVCLAEADILNALQKLSFGNQSEADQARKRLLDDSRRSPACRKQLIITIMRAMDKPNLDFKSDPDSYWLWRHGAELLGDLKATEALDLLIKHLDLTNGTFSTTMSQQPALSGVITMGPVAIPKLAEVLGQSPDPNMRRYAVYCITGIGGDTAVSALKEALPSESDECVSRFIRVSIDTLNNKSSRYSTDQVKWFWAFMCDE